MTGAQRRRACAAATAGALLAIWAASPSGPGRAQPVQEQRARLPPAAPCADPVVGTWLAHRHYAHVGEWGRITLRIRRTPGSATALEGTIHAHWWDGGPGNAAPPSCGPGVRMFSVLENARGEVNGNQLRFDAIDYRADQPSCGALPPYLLDLFRGTLDPALGEFQAVLNADSPQWVNVPTLFRRVSCGDPGTATPPPRPVPLPPPPSASSGGCSCFR